MFRTDYQIQFLSLWKNSRSNFFWSKLETVQYCCTWDGTLAISLLSGSSPLFILSDTTPGRIRWLQSCHLANEIWINSETEIFEDLEILVYGERLVTTVFWTRDSWFIIYREDIYYWVRPWAPRILHSNLHSALNVVSGRHTSGSVSLVIRAQGE